jgi:diguanylate cyclase (GGDEF)-like protein
MLNPKILLVNDDAASLLALKSILATAAERDGYGIVTAHSGEEALRKVLKEDFAVILLDVNMPVMDGFETAEVIHSRPRSSKIPIIFITASDDEMNRLQGYRKGAVDYIFSPIIPQILQAKVVVFVELAKQKQELELKTMELARLNRDLRLQRIHDLERTNRELQAEIIERKQAEQRANELATRDSLTGLHNRRSLIDHLEHAVAYSARHKQTFALMFLDLNKFKIINDTLGHHIGDEILVQIATRIRNTVREADVVARLGGDEFVVLLKGLTTSDQVAQIAEKVALAISHPYDIGIHCLDASASIGIVMYPQDGVSAHALMKNADRAMYHSKDQRRNAIQFFNQVSDLRPATAPSSHT